jgi:hypothetical protein
MDLKERSMAPADTRNPDTENEPPAVKSPVEARAGLISGHVITILIVGTILAVVLLGIVWAVAGA